MKTQKFESLIEPVPPTPTESRIASPDVVEITPEQAWEEWRKNPGPDANRIVLDRLSSVIDKAAYAQVNTSNPLVRAKARKIALSALSTYRPGQTKLTTHIYNNMQSLKRQYGRITSGINVPEKSFLERKRLSVVEAELRDMLGRDPTDEELSNQTGYSQKKIKRLRGYTSAMSSGYFHTLGIRNEGLPFDPAVNHEENNTVLQLVYDDLSPTDKKVFEWTVGYNGQPRLSNQQIAERLRRSSGWVSQRRNVIQRSIDEMTNVKPYVTG